MQKHHIEVTAIWLRTSIWDLQTDQISFYYLGEYLAPISRHKLESEGNRESLSYFIFHLDGLGMARLYLKPGYESRNYEDMLRIKEQLHTLLKTAIDKHRVSG